MEVPEVVEVMRCVLLCMLEAVEGGLCLREVLEAVEVSEAMHCVLLCIVEAVEAKVPEVMHYVLFCLLEVP